MQDKNYKIGISHHGKSFRSTVLGSYWVLIAVGCTNKTLTLQRGAQLLVLRLGKWTVAVCTDCKFYQQSKYMYTLQTPCA